MITAPALTAKGSVMRPVRRPNAEYRVREHLTETAVEKLLAALKGNRQPKGLAHRPDDLSSRSEGQRGLRSALG